MVETFHSIWTSIQDLYQRLDDVPSDQPVKAGNQIIHRHPYRTGESFGLSDTGKCPFEDICEPEDHPRHQTSGPKGEAHQCEEGSCRLIGDDPPRVAFVFDAGSCFGQAPWRPLMNCKCSPWISIR